MIGLAHLTEAQRRTDRLADNELTELGTSDEAPPSAELKDLQADDVDLPLVGFSDGELERLPALAPDGGGQGEGGAGGTAPPVKIPEPPRTPASRTADLWLLGDHRLFCGDSTSHDDVGPPMNKERAILFANDPPYSSTTTARTNRGRCRSTRSGTRCASAPSAAGSRFGAVPVLAPGRDPPPQGATKRLAVPSVRPWHRRRRSELTRRPARAARRSAGTRSDAGGRA